MPGQFVLTGLSPDGPQHLLLMDRTGKVSHKTVVDGVALNSVS